MEYKQQIFQIINAIPKGYVASYGYVARQAGLARGARLVGMVLKSLPTDTCIPWFRVINSKREISFPVNSEKFLHQKQKLASEGTPFQGLKVNKNHILDYLPLEDLPCDNVAAND